MSQLFYGRSVGQTQQCRTFNAPLGKWDVSRVSLLEAMFKEASAYNQPLQRWDLSSVTNMQMMFQMCASQVVCQQGGPVRASAFNQPLQSWDVSRVTTMQEMFSVRVSPATRVPSQPPCAAVRGGAWGGDADAETRGEGWLLGC